MEELQTLGESLDRVRQRLSHLQGSGEGHERLNRHKYTTLEAAVFNVPCDKEPPDPVPCEHCGKLRYFEGVCHNRRIILWLPLPQRCDCAEAVRVHEAQMAAEAEQKRLEGIEQERKRKQSWINRLIGDSGIQRRFRSRTFERFAVTDENRAAYETARAYVENFSRNAEDGRGLYFEGTCGTGKTHLAAAIALRLMQCGIPCLFRTSIDLLGDIKQTFHDDYTISEKAVLKVYREAELLVIDDLGKEVCSDWSNAMLYSVLNARYEDLRPTLITTNYSDEALIARLTPKHGDGTNMVALMSRLKECSRVITMIGKDWRTNA